VKTTLETSEECF
jgi:centrin-1